MYSIVFGGPNMAAAHKARTAAEAVEKARYFEAQGHKVTITDPDGEVVDLHTLELAVRGTSFGDA